jgi:hypothetical protein
MSIEADLDEPEDSEEVDDTGCTRCDAPLIFLGEQRIHEGGAGFNFLFGSGLFEDRLRVEMFACEDCGHVEFFMPLRKKSKLFGSLRKGSEPSGPAAGLG